MSKDYNLEEEYGWLLTGVVNYVDANPEEFIKHYGVLGMKWGVTRSEKALDAVAKVRKRKQPSAKQPALGSPKALGPEKISLKTKAGDTLTLTKNPPTLLHKALWKVSENYRKSYSSSAMLTIKDKDDKKVGDAFVTKVNNDELNLNWIGIDTSARGNGYATAALRAAAEFGKQEGFKEMTLEVPGNAPDALHIYEKLGFKVDHAIDADEDDFVWGGLTSMKYTFDKKAAVSHHQDVDDFLQHYGVLGMKWGVRKDDRKPLMTSEQKKAAARLAGGCWNPSGCCGSNLCWIFSGKERHRKHEYS